MLRHDLIERHGVEHAGFGIMQRSSRQPHIGAHMRVSLEPIGMIKPAQEAELLAEGTEWLG
jgi:hypothetical protein